MNWFGFLLPVIAAALLVILPGYVVVRILGIKGLWSWSLSAPASVSVLVAASLLGPLVGIPWSILTLVAAWVGVCLIAVILRLIEIRLHTTVATERRPRVSATVAVSLLLAAVLLGAQLLSLVGSPENFSQSFDNVFHLNAVRYVLDTSNASPLHVGSMTSPSGGVWFYPSAWHGFLALIVQITGSSIPVASNAAMFALAGLVWPASLLLLTVTLFGSGRSLMFAASVLAAAIPAFPLLMIDYGVLYPYFMGLCLLPALVAATLRVFRLSRAGGPTSWALIVAIVGSVPGLLISHPGSFVAYLFVAVLVGVVAFGRFMFTRPARKNAALASVGLALFLGLAFVTWRVLRPPVEARGWPTTETIGQSVGEISTLSMHYGPVALVAAILFWIGVVRAAQRRSISDVIALLLFVVFATLYIASTSFPWPSLRDLLTAAWYNNAPRLAALIPMVAIPLASVGATYLFAIAKRHVSPYLGTKVKAAAVSTAAIALLVLVTQAGAMHQALGSARENYALTDNSPLVSEDEMTILSRLTDTVPKDAVIAGNPWTGTALAYALTGRRVLLPHLLTEVSEDASAVNEGLTDATEGSATCAAANRAGVEFVLDFGKREVHGAEHEFPGLERLLGSDAVVLVDSEGSARLFEVVACE